MDDIKARREEEYHKGFWEMECPKCRQREHPFVRVEPLAGKAYKVREGLVEVIIECPGSDGKPCGKRLAWKIIEEVWKVLHGMG